MSQRIKPYPGEWEILGTSGVAYRKRRGHNAAYLKCHFRQAMIPVHQLDDQAWGRERAHMHADQQDIVPWNQTSKPPRAICPVGATLDEPVNAPPTITRLLSPPQTPLAGSPPPLALLSTPTLESPPPFRQL
ncbi:unnamed protein product [Tilletia controversa]|uniref:Uncharacterized protein n=3 Tax=Tilletia TaxID=13289 RepID=A0A8X7MTK4_9BASI|nr:hypothetical protein CF336_g7806 [Tilletia laevis]KAE8190110.1 hypothetical protein CF328_g6067 [Tilletia controversa]KAE8243170.1 hypothetical protein A4X03_0g7848 [Tilletia caries]KAE8186886.1 hypothetical protein CF335_g7319 [Tilletia laevis]KAE8248087.1 hypothetical protein A4X06_0g3967 [Tilletia controversa]